MSEQEMIARALGAEILRQCCIGAGDFETDPETGLWQVRADLDADSLARAILTTLASRTPEGMVMVPSEPTEAMVEAGSTYELGCRRDCSLGAPRAWEVWTAMLSASPTPSGAE